TGGAHVERERRHLGQRDVGLGVALVPAERAAAHVDRLEAGFVREPRHDRIERDRRDHEFVTGDEISERCHDSPPFSGTPEFHTASPLPEPKVRGASCRKCGISIRRVTPPRPWTPRPICPPRRCRRYPRPSTECWPIRSRSI